MRRRVVVLHADVSTEVGHGLAAHRADGGAVVGPAAGRATAPVARMRSRGGRGLVAAGTLGSLAARLFVPVFVAALPLHPRHCTRRRGFVTRCAPRHAPGWTTGG